jgi:hypothetical protein
MISPRDNDIHYLTDDHIKLMLANLPQTPMHTVTGGDLSLEDLYPQLTKEELERVYTAYKATGGTMVLRHETKK